MNRLFKEKKYRWLIHIFKKTALLVLKKMQIKTINTMDLLFHGQY